MATLKHVVFLFALTAMLSFCLTDAEDTSSGMYIIHAIKPDKSLSSTQDFEELESWHQSLMPTSTTSESQQRMIYSYRHVMNGFAAKLTEEEAKVLKEKEGVLSVLPDVSFSLHTTHSPKFLGLNQNLGVWKDSNFGRGIIIGVVDTGIKYDHPSFSDHGMPSPPAKWKGFCEFTGKSTCNNKLIGARNLVNKFSEVKEDLSDNFHHGTHTSGIAAGGFVSDASVFGDAQGTAVGMAPFAHIAMYKVCSLDKGCPSTAILAAFDVAIEDGVDILSLSLGLESVPFFLDVMALGAFAATQKGILVSCSAGNGGPEHGTLVNEAPWILTVGASTIDRSFRATVKLGNGEEFDGESIFQFQPKDFNLIPRLLVFPGENNTDDSVAICAPGSLTNIDVKGKVVLCMKGGFLSAAGKGEEVKNAGGAAMILANQEITGFSEIDATRVLPSSQVSYDAGLNIRTYINSTSTPTATIIFKGTIIGDALAPEVISFSSRGPNLQSPGILKPDIIGPGVNILAAWPISVDNTTHSNATFNIISGTSMSCPHLSGIAALIKSAHPDWSPAAIKSAIMTTSDLKNLGGGHIVDQTHQAADLFATGAGHVNPSRANDPGLIYDIKPDDYIPYLCGLQYSDVQVSMIVQRQMSCSGVKHIPEAQLNYPSFSILMGNETQGYTRTLTNVGPAKSTYEVELEVPTALGISVNPMTLTFTEVNQKLSYYVEFIPQIKENRKNLTHTQGYIKWVSDKHSVASPISITFK